MFLQVGLLVLALVASALSFEDPELLQHLSNCHHPPGFHTAELAQIALHSQTVNPIIADYLSGHKVSKYSYYGFHVLARLGMVIRDCLTQPLIQNFSLGLNLTWT